MFLVHMRGYTSGYTAGMFPPLLALPPALDPLKDELATRTGLLLNNLGQGEYIKLCACVIPDKRAQFLGLSAIEALLSGPGSLVRSTARVCLVPKRHLIGANCDRRQFSMCSGASKYSTSICSGASNYSTSICSDASKHFISQVPSKASSRLDRG
jgi:hypothetical protein